VASASASPPPPSTRPPETPWSGARLDRQLELMTLEVKRSFDSDRDIGNALTADQQGLGSGPDLTQDGKQPAGRSRESWRPAQALIK
jgi:hypothetical protein